MFIQLMHPTTSNKFKCSDCGHIFYQIADRPVYQVCPNCGKTGITINNNTSLTLEQIFSLPKYGWYRNFWRGRIVEIYQHPTEHPKRIITVGYHPRDGKPNGLLTIETAMEVFICDEENHSWSKEELEKGQFRDYY